MLYFLLVNCIFIHFPNVSDGDAVAVEFVLRFSSPFSS